LPLRRFRSRYEAASERGRIPCQTAVQGGAVDATNFYWVTNLANGAVAKAPIAGGPTTEVASAQNLPVWVEVDDKAIYWVDHGSNQIMKIAK
jgi:hypothetical protein